MLLVAVLTGGSGLQNSNIGPAGRRRRLRIGLVSFGAALLLAIVIFALGARLAARGRRDMDTGAEPITDPVELAWVRSQARRVHVKSLLLSIVVTAIVMLI